MSKISVEEQHQWGVSLLETGDIGEYAQPGKETSSNIGKVAVAFSTGEHITKLGTYLSARIGELIAGDLVQVSLTASAKDSTFYYSIKEVTGNAVSLIPNEQIIANEKTGWRSITANGLFKVINGGIVVFSAVFRDVDNSTRMTVFQLGLIAKVVGR